MSTPLRDATAAILAAEMDLLGDEITYTPAGGSATRFNAHVEFATEHVNSTGSAATAYPKAIEVAFYQVPNPSKADRIQITLRPGLIFAPSDIQEGDIGETWIMPLKRVVS